MAKRKRVVIISDTHCGHRAGLTPPDYVSFDRLEDARREYWDYFAGVIRSLQPIDVLIHNGDAIDGKGKTGGDEHIASSIDDQARMAEDVIRFCKAKKVYMVVGTPFHVESNGMLIEHLVADRIGADKIGNHEWLNVHGCVFDFKHHLGSSSIPHGRHTAIARDKLWNQLYAQRDWQPLANVIIRSHVHYHQYTGDGRTLALTTPALQGHGSRYGSLRCSGLVDFGLIHFDVEADGSYTWQAHLADLPAQRAQALQL